MLSEVKGEALARQTGVTPCVAVVLVGDRPDSAVYVRNKKKAVADVTESARACSCYSGGSSSVLNSQFLRQHLETFGSAMVCCANFGCNISFLIVVFRI